MVQGGAGHAAIRRGNYKLVLGDPGPPDVWSEPVNELSPLATLPKITSWNTTIQLFDVIKDVREQTDISANNQDIVSDESVTIVSSHNLPLGRNYQKLNLKWAFVDAFCAIKFP
jgi:hypothetical protein